MCWRRWLLHLWQDISEWSFEPLEGAASCGSLDKYIKLITHVYKSCIILCARYVYYPSPLLDAVCPFSSAHSWHQKPTARLPGCLAFQLQHKTYFGVPLCLILHRLSVLCFCGAAPVGNDKYLSFTPLLFTRLQPVLSIVFICFPAVLDGEKI